MQLESELKTRVELNWNCFEKSCPELELTSALIAHNYMGVPFILHLSHTFVSMTTYSAQKKKVNGPRFVKKVVFFRGDSLMNLPSVENIVFHRFLFTNKNT